MMGKRKMSEAISREGTRLDRAVDALLSPGRALFALAIVALGTETLVSARYTGHSLGPRYDVLPVLPWLLLAPG